ncbi:MAG: phosphopyruvate hydratase, partial [Patescibacteria group bacterium]|nr:phosphopyruvate hydratase [Patescibacteria group bacterium]
MKIKKIHARQILDSRGNPTIETDLILEDGSFGRVAIPSGASTGANEALELRDGDPKLYLGKSVLKAVENVNTKISNVLTNSNIIDQGNLDQIMINLDGTENKSALGANAILSVSLAFAKACAVSQKIPLYKHINNISGLSKQLTLPLPMMNVINGGAHADFASDIQEFMIMPVGASNFSHCLQIGSEIFHTLKKIIKENGYDTTVGDEGGFAPKVKKGNKESLELMSKAVEKAGYRLGTDVMFALDFAASEFYEKGKYFLKTENKTFGT